MDDQYSAVLGQVDAELAADAMSVAVGVYATVSLADRLRAAMDAPVAIELVGAGRTITGRVRDVTPDAVSLADGETARVVRLAQVGVVHGLLPGHREAWTAGQGRRTVATLLRPWVGHQARLELGGSALLAGMVQRVGVDHVELVSGDKSCVVATAAIAWAEGPALG